MGWEGPCMARIIEAPGSTLSGVAGSDSLNLSWSVETRRPLGWSQLLQVKQRPAVAVSHFPSSVENA